MHIRFLKLRVLCLGVFTILLLLSCETTRTNGKDSAEMISTEKFQIEGYIISKENDRLLIVENLSKEQADTKKYTTNQILEKANPHATWISAADPLSSNDYQVGERIQVTIKGGVDASFPAQAAAEKIEVLK